MSKKPYFTTADRVAVEAPDTIYVIISGKKKFRTEPRLCIYASKIYDPETIFSTRAAAQAECDKRNAL